MRNRKKHNYMKNKSLASYVRKWANEEGERVAFCEYRKGTWVDFTFQEYKVAAERLAKKLLDENNTGTIGSIGTNTVGWNILDLAIDMLGGTHASFFPTFEPETVNWIISSTLIQTLYVPNKRWVDMIGSQLANVHSNLELRTFDSLIENKTFGDVDVYLESNSPEGKSIMFTSGTSTIRPKAVLHKNSSLMVYANSLDVIYDLTSTDSGLSFLPICHGYERGHNYLFQLKGLKMTYASSILSVADNLSANCPTFLTAVPKIANDVVDAVTLNLPRTHPTHLPRIIASSGATLSKKSGHFFTEKGVVLIQSYGLTECLGVASQVISNSSNDNCGNPHPYVEVKLSEGQILIKSETMLVGYVSGKGVTNPLDKDGFFATGDMGFLDEHGLVVYGREGDIFKVANGKFYDPRAVENKLAEVTGFAICPVLILSERLELYLIVQGKEQILPEVQEDVRQFIEEHNQVCPEWETIEKILFVEEEWNSISGHLTHNGKLKRHAIAKAYLFNDRA